MEETYPFRHYLADAIMWCLSTDVDEARKGPQLELSLGGIARDLVREIPLEYKLRGATVDLNDGQGPQQLTGAAFILNGLAARFAPLEEEANMRSLADLYGFSRLPGETVDMVLTRWEVVVQRARVRAGIAISVQHSAWMLLLALRLPVEYWVHLLTPFRGSLPQNENEYRQFTEYVKRFGHLAEAGSHAINQGATHGPSVLASWAFPVTNSDTDQTPGNGGNMNSHALNPGTQQPGVSGFLDTFLMACSFLA